MPRDLKELPTERSENDLDREWHTSELGHELHKIYAAPARRTEHWMLAATIAVVVVGILALIAAFVY